MDHRLFHFTPSITRSAVFYFIHWGPWWSGALTECAWHDTGHALGMEGGWWWKHMEPTIKYRCLNMNLLLKYVVLSQRYTLALTILRPLTNLNKRVFPQTVISWKWISCSHKMTGTSPRSQEPLENWIMHIHIATNCVTVFSEAKVLIGYFSCNVIRVYLWGDWLRLSVLTYILIPLLCLKTEIERERKQERPQDFEMACHTKLSRFSSPLWLFVIVKNKWQHMALTATMCVWH